MKHLLLLIASIFALHTSSAAGPNDRPNIILLVADDLARMRSRLTTMQKQLGGANSRNSSRCLTGFQSEAPAQGKTPTANESYCGNNLGIRSTHRAWRFRGGRSPKEQGKATVPGITTNGPLTRVFTIQRETDT